MEINTCECEEYDKKRNKANMEYFNTYKRLEAKTVLK